MSHVTILTSLEENSVRRFLNYTSPRYSFLAVMISPALGRTAQKVVLQQCCTKPMHRRGLATAASATFSYETSEAAGVKIGSRNIDGPTTYLALVAKAGTRYQPLPGATEALEKFAFKVGSTILIEYFSGHSSLIKGNSEYTQTVRTSNNEGNRAIGSSAYRVSLAGKYSHRRQIFTGRPPIYCGIAGRVDLTDKIHTYISLSSFGPQKLIKFQVMSFKKRLSQLSNCHKNFYRPMQENSQVIRHTVLHFIVDLAHLYIQRLVHRLPHISIMQSSQSLAEMPTRSRILLLLQMELLTKSCQSGFTSSLGILKAVHDCRIRGKLELSPLNTMVEKSESQMPRAIV